MNHFFTESFPNKLNNFFCITVLTIDSCILFQKYRCSSRSLMRMMWGQNHKRIHPLLLQSFSTYEAPFNLLAPKKLLHFHQRRPCHLGLLGVITAWKHADSDFILVMLFSCSVSYSERKKDESHQLYSLWSPGVFLSEPFKLCELVDTHPQTVAQPSSPLWPRWQPAWWCCCGAWTVCWRWYWLPPGSGCGQAAHPAGRTTQSQHWIC